MAESVQHWGSVNILLKFRKYAANYTKGNSHKRKFTKPNTYNFQFFNTHKLAKKIIKCVTDSETESRLAKKKLVFRLEADLLFETAGKSFGRYVSHENISEKSTRNMQWILYVFVMKKRMKPGQACNYRYFTLDAVWRHDVVKLTYKVLSGDVGTC